MSAQFLQSFVENRMHLLEAGAVYFYYCTSLKSREILITVGDAKTVTGICKFFNKYFLVRFFKSKILFLANVECTAAHFASGLTGFHHLQVVDDLFYGSAGGNVPQ